MKEFTLFYIQDPIFSKSYSTHEALIETCIQSVKGYGSYAFASATGIEVLFEDKEFDALLDRGTYSMIVGIDEITNMKSLDKLSDIVAKKQNFSVKAYYQESKSSLFHPKFSFFQQDSGKGTLIAGSGNLTLGGLRKNKEAFGVIPLSVDEFKRIEDYWGAWLSEASQNLRDIDDNDVIEKARENIYKKRLQALSKEQQIEVSVDVEDEESELESSITEGWHYGAGSQILVAEIPKSGDRWKQANFDVGTFQNFFGARPGDNSQRILLRSVKDDSMLSSIEIRPSVSVKSKNYRFELDAATGLLYPVEGPPIGIFIQLTTRMFLYHLFMPDHDLYEEIASWMNDNWQGRADRMKRIVASSDDLDSILSKSVFSRYKV